MNYFGDYGLQKQREKESLEIRERRQLRDGVKTMLIVFAASALILFIAGFIVRG